ncbi:MAG: N-acetylmuramoyl-L-alanine amidase [Treponema sp.]|jgi:N-acetylmuramoyl-L-alanine amidase|nr:N-acetylmuramoyl-L-alanine amidase [Treponema sp.]
MRNPGRLYPFFFLVLMCPAPGLPAQQPPGQILAAQTSVPAARTAGTDLPAPGGEKTLSLDETLAGLAALPGARRQSAEFRWDPFFQNGTLALGDHFLSFAAGETGETGPALLDGRELLYAPLPRLDAGSLVFPEAFVTAAKTAFSRAFEEDNSRFRIAAIIVDPGHGGKDSGAVGNFTIRGRALKSVEKDITLAVSRELHRLLSQAWPDKRIMLTREGDSYPTLEGRVDIANSVPLRENEAIIFISIHANASFNRQARGYEVWYLSPDYRRSVIDKSKFADSAEILPILNDMMEEEFTNESVMMAKSILDRLGEAVGNRMPSRGIKAEEWFVVRNARMPSVLVELGFVTNETDALLMADETYLKQTAGALYKGIADFVTAFERSGGFTALQ